MSLASLVAYNSSSSDDDEEPITTTSSMAIQKQVVKNGDKKGNKVKIFAPKRVEYNSDNSDNEDEPPVKRAAKSTNSVSARDAAKSSCGLFAKLPAPNSSFGGKKNMDQSKMVPYVLTKRPTPAPKKPPIKRKAPVVVNTADSDHDDGDDDVSFFSFHDDKETATKKEPTRQEIQAALLNQQAPPHTVPAPASQMQSYGPTSNEAYSYGPRPSTNNYGPTPTMGYQMDNYGSASTMNGQMSNYGPAPTVGAQMDSYGPSASNYGYQEAAAPQSSASQDWIQAEQLMRLKGKKNSREKIEIIDVHADDALEGTQQMLMKSITKEASMNRQSHSKKGVHFTSRQKSKHQLSYLIHQAKANEIQLQEQWAAGKEKRDVARMRYGF